ncbi:MAG: tetraacyldisaccharide 4'-kinase, partial [candidate division Zixibacteria bacterium RBG_16_40_9]
MLEKLKFSSYPNFNSKIFVILRPFLLLFSWIYLFLGLIRNLLYSLGIFKTHNFKKDFPQAKVISVGNITAGGTGKTPWTIFLADKISKSGKKVTILTRGYGRKSSGQVVLDEESKKNKNWQEVGDEPFLMASKLNGIPIVVNSDRAEAGQWTLQHNESEVLLLDDGFQNKSIKKNLEIVLIDATNPFGNFKLLPAGILREPLRNLRRADLLVLNKVDRVSSKEQLLDHLKTVSTAPIVESGYEISHAENINSGQTIPRAELKGKSCLAFCGIASPFSFTASLKELQLRVVETKFFPDHYVYKERDILDLVKQGLTQKVDFLAT